MLISKRKRSSVPKELPPEVHRASKRFRYDDCRWKHNRTAYVEKRISISESTSGQSILDRIFSFMFLLNMSLVDSDGTFMQPREAMRAIWSWMGSREIYSFLMMDVVLSYVFCKKKHSGASSLSITAEDLDDAFECLPSILFSSRNIEQSALSVVLVATEIESLQDNQYMKVFARFQTHRGLLFHKNICSVWDEGWCGEFEFAKYFRGVDFIENDYSGRSEIFYVFGTDDLVLPHMHDISSKSIKGD